MGEIEKIKVVQYCLANPGYMWSASILAIIFDCDFRESERIATQWLLEIKKP